MKNNSPDRKEIPMRTPEWLKPALWGAAAGAAALAITGFSWGGWMTASAAEDLASDRARTQVVAALVPICMQQASRDPQLAAQLDAMREARSYKRRDMVMEAGWATMPGMEEANRRVADACMERLTADF